MALCYRWEQDQDPRVNDLLISGVKGLSLYHTENSSTSYLTGDCREWV